MKLTPLEERARERVCLPLDNLRTWELFTAPVKELAPVVGLFKVGMEAYFQFGQRAVEYVHEQGSRVFLDLKPHDIPRTVAGAVRAITDRDVFMLTMHVAAGEAAMRRAVEVADRYAELPGKHRPNIVGVTVLTSIGPPEFLLQNYPLVPTLDKQFLMDYRGMKTGERNDQESFAHRLVRAGYDYLVTHDSRGIRCNVVEQQVRHLTELARMSGLDGVVCAAADLHAMATYPDFLYVTPGIQGVNTPAGRDQLRVMTPGQAIKDGASVLVVGSAIVNHSTPEQRLRAGYEILQDMAPHMNAA